MDFCKFLFGKNCIGCTFTNFENFSTTLVSIFLYKEREKRKFNFNFHSSDCEEKRKRLKLKISLSYKLGQQ